MTTWLALVMWTWVPDATALQVYTRAFADVYDVDCDETLAAAWIEGRHLRNPTSKRRPTPWSPSSPWGICGAYQLTGGRYGRPRCALMVSWLWIAAWAGVVAVDYWQGRCWDRWYCGYNRGNVGCSGGCNGGQARMERLSRAKPWED